MNEIRGTDNSLIDHNKSSLCYTLFYREMTEFKNAHILNPSIDYILSTERLSVHLAE